MCVVGTSAINYFQDHQGGPLPGGAVQRGGRAAREVLLDALVVSDLCRNRDRGGFSPWGNHWCLS